MKKKDIILIVVLLCLALAGLVVVRYMQGGEGAKVVITVDGETFGTYDLNKDTSIDIKDDEGYNKVVISNGYVDMTEADCPDKICVDHAPIHNNHETIICLPHKVVVEISGGEDSGIDVQAQ